MLDIKFSITSWRKKRNGRWKKKNKIKEEQTTFGKMRNMSTRYITQQADALKPWYVCTGCKWKKKRRLKIIVHFSIILMKNTNFTITYKNHDFKKIYLSDFNKFILKNKKMKSVKSFLIFKCNKVTFFVTGANSLRRFTYILLFTKKNYLDTFNIICLMYFTRTLYDFCWWFNFCNFLI